MSLTVKRVARLMRRGDKGRHLDGGASGQRGLYLVVAHKTAAHWELRFQVNRRARWMGLGSARTFTLEQARQRAKAAREQLADKIDPLDQRRAERAQTLAIAAVKKTLKECAELYIAAHRAEWRSAQHGADWLSTLQRYVYPKIGSLNVADVGVPQVLAVLEQPVDGGGTFWDKKTITADRVRNRIELILTLAMARGYRPRGDNPAGWMFLKEVLSDPSRAARTVPHAAVPYRDVPALLQQLRQHEGVSVKALTFAILTAARSKEVLQATWREIDFDNKVWTIPAARMKGNREHKVPLSPQAIDLLRSLYTESGNDFLFIGARQPGLTKNTMTAMLRRLGRSETVHGFRSSFSDWAHAETAHSNHTIEISLAHTVGNEVERAYRRTDMFAKRRTLMEQWSKFVVTSPRSRTGDNVTTLRAVPS